MTILLAWLHVLAAVGWIGGMLFLSLVLVPVLRKPPLAQHRGLLFPVVARHFRLVAWGALCVLLATGPFLALGRGIDLFDLSTWPSAFRLKLGLVLVLVTVSAVHDLFVGPRITQILQRAESERTPDELRLVRWAPLLARSTVLVGLAVLYAAVLFARS